MVTPGWTSKRPRKSRWVRPVDTGRTHHSTKLLVGLLALLGDLRAAARGVGFGFLLCRVALGFGLVLLGLAFAGQVIATGQGAGSFLDFALDALNGALDGFCGSRVFFVRHDLIPPQWRT